MIIEITKPETETLIQRHLQSGRFHDIDEPLTTALDALQEPVAPPAPEAKNLDELFAPVRGLFADGELDFGRNPSVSRS
jgi:hypothetical protein